MRRDPAHGVREKAATALYIVLALRIEGHTNRDTAFFGPVQEAFHLSAYVEFVLAAIPCGWWFGVQQPQRRYVALAAFLVGLFVSFCIELLHFGMVSGVSQGASVVTRAIGMALGAWTYSMRHRIAPVHLDRAARWVALAVGGSFAPPRPGCSRSAQAPGAPPLVSLKSARRSWKRATSGWDRPSFAP